MGHREYFMSSDKYAPEDIVREWKGKIEFNSSKLEPTVFLFTKAKVKKDFTWCDEPFTAGEVGFTFEPDGVSFADLGYMLPDDMLNSVKLRDISFMDDYQSCFEDMSLVVDGVNYSEGVTNSKGQPICDNAKRMPKVIEEGFSSEVENQTDYDFE